MDSRAWLRAFIIQVNRIRSKVIVSGALVALTVFASAQTAMRTTAFNAKLHAAANRTVTVDETIDLYFPPGATAPDELVLAEAPTGSRPVQFLISRATIGGAGGPNTDIHPTTAKDRITYKLTSGQASDRVELHVNYSVLGAFTDRSGGSLGNRSTMSWNIVPADWPTSIESGLFEMEYPGTALPLYVGINSGDGGGRLSVTKTRDTAFSGSVSALNVSETHDGVTVQPTSGIAEGAGLRVLVAFSREDLTAAPAKLSAPSPPTPKPAAKTKPIQTPPTKPAATQSEPAKPGLWPVFLPLVPGVVFLVLYWKRLSPFGKHTYPTSAVPEGVGPAEAGFLLEGHLKQRHLLGSIAAIVNELPTIKGEPAASEENLFGPTERRLVEIFEKKQAPLSTKEIHSTINVYHQELSNVVANSLAQKGLLFPSAKRSKWTPGVSLLLSLAVACGYSIYLDQQRGGIFSALGVLLSLFLLWRLSPLTPKGVRAHRRVAGLNRFLYASAKEFNNGAAEYMEPLKPFAIAFGVLTEKDQA